MVQRFTCHLPGVSQATRFLHFPLLSVQRYYWQRFVHPMLSLLFSAPTKAFAFVEISAECFFQRRLAKTELALAQNHQ